MLENSAEDYLSFRVWVVLHRLASLRVLKLAQRGERRDSSRIDFLRLPPNDLRAPRGKRITSGHHTHLQHVVLEMEEMVVRGQLVLGKYLENGLSYCL